MKDHLTDSSSTHEHDKIYTCPMHPEIIRHEPGSCPICGMDLVEKKTVRNIDSITSETIVEPIEQRIINQNSLTTPINKTFTTSVVSKGYLTYNPKNIATISSRFTGRIDKLYVRYNYQEVTKGQKLMEVYSPELVTAQENYIFILNNKEADITMANSAKQKLTLLGMNDIQIEHLEKTRKAEYLIEIYAPVSGHIHQMSSLNELTMPTMSMQENNISMTGNNAQALNIREGNYVKKGESIFSIVSLSDIWAIFKIYPEDVSKIKVGQEVEINSEIAPDNTLKAKVNFIEPIIEKGSKFISIRVYLEKCDHHIFKVGSLVNGIIHTGEINGLWIPKTSTLTLGNGNTVVFKKLGTSFKAFPVTIGTKENNYVNILQGITKEDTIVTDASYMIDSESFVTTK